MMNTDISDTSDHYPGGDRGISPKLDVTLDLLSNRRRRYVLYCLRDEGGSVSVDELTEQVVAWEDENDRMSAPELGEDAPDERVVADLHHCQLPRLVESGAVDYDPDEGDVSLAATDGEPIMEYLDLAASEETVR